MYGSLARIAWLAALLVANVGIASQANAETLLERAKREGFVRVAFANEEPFSYVTPDGNLVGEDVDVARVILKQMGIPEIDGVLTSWSSLVPALKSNRIDMIAVGMFVRPKRCEEVAFTEPVFGIGEAFLVKKGNPKNLNTFGDVAKDATARLGVLAGTSEVDYAKWAEIPDGQVQLYPDFTTELAALKSGRVDAIAMVAITAEREILKEGPDSGIERAPVIEAIGDHYLKGHGAFGFRKSDADFVAEFNKLLVAYLGTKEHLDLVAQYGFTKAELPEKTTAELCASEGGQ